MTDFFLTALGLTLLAGVICAPVGCTMYEDSIIAAQAARGGDPVRVACAMSPMNLSRTQACTKQLELSK